MLPFVLAQAMMPVSSRLRHYDSLSKSAPHTECQNFLHIWFSTHLGDVTQHYACFAHSTLPQLFI